MSKFSQKSVRAQKAAALPQPGGLSAPMAFASLALGFAAGAAIYAAFKPDRTGELLERFTAWIDGLRPGPTRGLLREIRAAIGPVVGNPGSVTVQVRGTCAILKGPVLKSELKGLLAAVYGVPGVTEIHDRLEVHETSAGVPGLQGRREWDHARNQTPVTSKDEGGYGGQSEDL